MKQAVMLVVILALATFVSAQTQTPPAPAGTAATTPPPQGKRPPQAKTQAEFDAYKAAAANAADGAAMEKGADDFAAKFPDSELRILLYRNAMHAYQTANSSEKMMDMGRKVLKIDPDDPEALVGVAQVLAERTRESDLDKDQRLDEGTKLAQHALETADTDITVPPGNSTGQGGRLQRIPALQRILCAGHHPVHPGKVRGRRRLFPQVDGRLPCPARPAGSVAPGAFAGQAGKIS